MIPSSATSTSIPTPAHGSVSLVIADDEAPIRMVVGEKLRAAGFIVHEARDGEEALELARKHQPIGVVTDLQMPYMNGLELCTALKADPITGRIPAVLLTARGHVLTDEMLGRTNIIKLMSKPFGVRDLLSFVQEKLVPAGLAAKDAGASDRLREAA